MAAKKRLKTRGEKFRVGVLMGGRSVEREVSFNSGRTVCDHIDVDRYEVVPIFQTVLGELYLLPLKFLHRGKIADFEHRLVGEATRVAWDELKQLVDFVYIALHGYNAEDGTLQGMLEVLKIPYLGSKVHASACGMDKVFQKKILSGFGIVVPRGIWLSPREVKTLSVEEILKRMTIQFPVFVKPALEGSSFGISVVFSADELMPALKKACWEEVTYEQPVLIEERIEGMEFTCIALEQNHLSGLPATEKWVPLPITEVLHEKGTFFHDYQQKYMPGRSTKITPARCTPEETEAIQRCCLTVADILGFTTFFRTDGFLTKDGTIVITDPNSLSGMGPASFLFHQAAEVGMHHTRLINYLIDSELDRYGLLENIFLEQQGRKKGAFVEVQKRIVVLLGGDSHEREISLESGRNVCYKLSPSKYEVIPVFVDEHMNLYKLSSRLLIQNSTREIAELVTPDLQIAWAELPSLCDFVFIALHGGKGENGCVQGTLETLGLPYNGPGVLASSLCMDKHRTNLFLMKQGFDVPKSRLVTREELASEDLIASIESATGYPLIVKPHDDGCSVYVFKATCRQELKHVLQEYFATEKNVALVEECIQGMELTCGVLGNDEVRALPPSQAISSKGVLSLEEKFLPGAGENQTPAKLPPQAILFVQDVMKRAYTTVGCKGYTRIDCFYQDKNISPTGNERVVILEFNTLPGLTPATCLFHQAAEVGIKPMELIDEIVELGFEARRGKVQAKQGSCRAEK